MDRWPHLPGGDYHHQLCCTEHCNGRLTLTYRDVIYRNPFSLGISAEGRFAEVPTRRLKIQTKPTLFKFHRTDFLGAWLLLIEPKLVNIEFEVSQYRKISGLRSELMSHVNIEVKPPV